MWFNKKSNSRVILSDSKQSNDLFMYLLNPSLLKDSCSYFDVMDFIHKIDEKEFDPKDFVFFSDIQSLDMISKSYEHTLTLTRTMGAAPFCYSCDLGNYNFLKLGSWISFGLILTTHKPHSDFLDTDLYSYYTSGKICEFSISPISLNKSETLILRAPKFFPFASQKSILLS